MSAPHIPRHRPPPKGEPLPVWRPALTTVALAVAVFAVTAFGLWLNFGDPHSDHQRLNALEARVDALELPD